MDSLTHIAIGACIGDAFADRKVGKKAMLWGILAQGIPDLDFILAPLYEPTSYLMVHRGFSHSFLFAAIMIPLLSILAERFHRPHNISLKSWIGFFSISIGSHLFIDAFNNYGIGWLEPFSHSRFSFHILYVADPLLSLGPAVAALVLLIKGRHYRFRLLWSRIGLGAAMLYLSASCVLKGIVLKDMSADIRQNNLPEKMHFATPAPFQNMLWFMVSGNDSGFYAGYRSVWDRGPLKLTYYPKNDHLLDAVRHREDIRNLIDFSQGFYTVSLSGDTVMFNDLRFGQVIGWMDPGEDFSFHYYTSLPDANDMLVQRGRFEKLDKQSLTGLWRRMWGKTAVP